MNIVSGLSVRIIGKYTPFLIVGPMITAVGAGLLFTVDEFTKFANVIGYEILCGVGIGSIMQLGMLGAQAEYAKEKEKMGRVMGVLTFVQMLGGVIGLAVAGAVFNDELRSNLRKCKFDYNTRPTELQLICCSLGSCTRRSTCSGFISNRHSQRGFRDRPRKRCPCLHTIGPMGVRLCYSGSWHSDSMRFLHQE